MSYSYNRATNQLSKAAQTGGSTLSYGYDAAGNLTWDRVADIFGATVAQPAGMTTTNPLRFPGQQYDAATGLHYNHFRDYDPVLGRYIQSDPIVLAGGIDTYAYVGRNPLSGIDPLGLDALVIDSGPISGNPFGRQSPLPAVGSTALATTPSSVLR